MFSIRKKDGLARIGEIITKNGKISTPVLLPVINPNKQIIPPTLMVKYGVEAFITNAYLLFRDSNNKELALKKGLHKFIGFDGPLMTDSGAYQLMEYGEVSVTNKQITHFQEKIGSDIGVFLDCPTKSGTYEEFSLALEETLQRADEHIQSREQQNSVLWAGPIQGGKFLDLVEKSCMEMRKKEFQIHPIGSVVPLLERYDFENVVKMILTTKNFLPINRPIHLFGAGHPMFFAIAAFLGVDMFDSAAYILYAKKDRYLTVFGTDYFGNLQFFPCSCEICTNYSVNELKQMEKESRTELLSIHNLIVSLEEIKRVKQAIIEGRLYELVLSRVMNHPALAKIKNLLFSKSTSTIIEPYDPISKLRSKLITDPILAYQPLILRYQNRLLRRFHSWNSKLLIGHEFQNLHSTQSYQTISISPLFGIIPHELKGIYPLVQHERIPMEFSADIRQYINDFLEFHMSKFKRIEIHPSVDLKLDIFNQINTFEGLRGDKKPEKIHLLSAMVNYQFGKDTHLIFKNKQLNIERSRKTGVLRRFSDDLGLLGTFRASDFTIVPSQRLARLLHQYHSKPKLRVIAKEESLSFIMQNKDLLARFVKDVDSEIRCGEEVLITDDNDSFINFGKAVLSAGEMKAFKRGVAVQIRH
ncbi:MAG: tRNA guanosine(15) transglycosylase TgtA [Candidatus Hodarchaeales archaeon]|jgi:7-cyano-7-deazaguanine tRNA-ribosyltransferase